MACSTAGVRPAAAAAMQFPSRMLRAGVSALIQTRPLRPVAISKGKRLPRSCSTKLSRYNRLQQHTSTHMHQTLNYCVAPNFVQFDQPGISSRGGDDSLRSRYDSSTNTGARTIAASSQHTLEQTGWGPQ